MNEFEQEMKVKLFRIKTGKLICVLNEINAKELGLFAGDRVEITNRKKKKSAVGVIDVTDSMVKENQIGLFEEIEKKLGVKVNESVFVKATTQLKSLDFIKKKMDDGRLKQDEMDEIVKDISEERLTDVEASSFMSAVYMRGFDLNETIYMVKSLIKNGKIISFSKRPVVDKHSVGGVNGRATMIIVPIVACAGLYMPKTSSRSITSAAGTADVMEVLAPVDLSFEKIKSITEKIGGVITWGGAVDLAPADDKLIQLEHPLSLDPQGQVIASVLAKKASVGSKYVVIDLPVGPNAKIKTKEVAMQIAKKFVLVGKEVGMEVEAILTNGEEPSGLAFGPALEAKYVMEILEGKRFDNLAQKSCDLAGVLFELSGLCRQGQGYYKALDILHSGKALQKMKEIIYAQGGKIDSSTKIILSPLNYEVKASEDGIIKEMNLKTLTRIARIAGAPANKLAGLMLSKVIGDRVIKGELIYTIYAENKQKLFTATEYAKKNNPCKFKKVILKKVK